MPNGVRVVRIIKKIVIAIIVCETMSITFYHHTDSEVDGEVQGAPSRLCRYGDECPPIAADPKASGRWGGAD